MSRVVLLGLAEDMEAAAIDAGDHAPAGLTRAFAAERAIRADEIRECAYRAQNPIDGIQEIDDMEEEESPW